MDVKLGRFTKKKLNLENIKLGAGQCSLRK